MTADFKPKRTAVASRGFLATARLSCYITESIQRVHCAVSAHITFDWLKL